MFDLFHRVSNAIQRGLPHSALLQASANQIGHGAAIPFDFESVPAVVDPTAPAAG
jgi:hypothetical protein